MFLFRDFISLIIKREPKDCRLWDSIQVYLTTRQYAMLTKDIQQSKCYYFLRTRDEFGAHFEP
jgi:hypothetical protein